MSADGELMRAVEKLRAVVFRNCWSTPTTVDMQYFVVPSYHIADNIYSTSDKTKADITNYETVPAVVNETELLIISPVSTL